jgi:hypothetical protein
MRSLPAAGINALNFCIAMNMVICDLGRVQDEFSLTKARY